MSDGMTEGARDSWRARAETAFLDRLADHVQAPSDATWTTLQEAAGEVDGVRGGNFSSPTHWSRGLGDLVTGLLTRDAATWTKLLAGLVAGEGVWYGPARRLHDLSPYAGRDLVLYRKGNLEGDTRRPYRDAVSEAGLDEGGSYLMAVPRGAIPVDAVVPLGR